MSHKAMDIEPLSKECQNNCRMGSFLRLINLPPFYLLMFFRVLA